MPGVKVFLKRVSYCVLPVAGLGALLVKFPSLHNGLVKPDTLDWHYYSTDLNKGIQNGQGEWKPVNRLYPSLDFSKQKTHKVSMTDIQNKHFTHVYKTIQDEKLAERLSRYITKWDGYIAEGAPFSEYSPSESGYFDGRWREFLEHFQKVLADPAEFERVIFDPFRSVPNTEHFVSEIKGLRIHYSITDFENKEEEKGDGGASEKPKVGVLFLNGYPNNTSDWMGLLRVLSKNDKFKDSSVRPVFVNVSLPSMGTNFSEIAQRSEFGDFNIFSVSTLMRDLMENTLSDQFDEYIVVSNDWGGMVSELMAISADKNAGGSAMNRKMRGLLLSMPLQCPIPILEAALMQYSTKWVDYFLKDEPESVQQLFKQRGNDGPLIKMFARPWDVTAYQHFKNVRPHTAINIFGSDIITLAAYLFEGFLGWSSINNETDPQIRRDFYDAIISAVVYSYTNPGGVEGGISYYRENIQFFYTHFLTLKSPESMPVYVSVMGYDNFGKQTCDRYLKMRYPGLLNIYRNPSVGHFFCCEDPGILSDDLFDTLEDMSKNLLANKPKVLI